MAKISKKKAKRPLRAKVPTPIDVRALKAKGIILEHRYLVEMSAFNRMGLRGEKVCKHWTKGEGGLSAFECFLQDAGVSPFNRYRLSRIDESKPYSKTNCQWILRKLRKNLLAFDPGVQNFACSWIKNDKVVEAFVLDNTLEYIRQKTFDDDVSFFKAEVEKIIDDRRPSVVLIERFVPRRFSTGSAESINAAIGLMIAACNARGITVHLIMSSTWKNAMKRLSKTNEHADLDKLYKEAKAVLGLKKMVPHTVDASSMAGYFLNGSKVDDKSVIWIRKNLRNLKRLPGKESVIG